MPIQYSELQVTGPELESQLGPSSLVDVALRNETGYGSNIFWASSAGILDVIAGRLTAVGIQFFSNRDTNRVTTVQTAYFKGQQGLFVNWGGLVNPGEIPLRWYQMNYPSDTLSDIHRQRLFEVLFSKVLMNLTMCQSLSRLSLHWPREIISREGLPIEGMPDEDSGTRLRSAMNFICGCMTIKKNSNKL